VHGAMKLYFVYMAVGAADLPAAEADCRNLQAGSSELPELTLLSDRILVLREGRPTALLNRAQFSPETILEYASPGGSVQPAFAGMEFAQ